MQLRPRHLILLVLILGIFVFRVVKSHHDEHANQAPTQNALAAPAWSAYDKAAALRDAPDDQFKPAFAALRAATEDSNMQDPQTVLALSDVIHCKIWLDFYRRDENWKKNATKHVNGCMQYHRDTVA